MVPGSGGVGSGGVGSGESGGRGRKIGRIHTAIVNLVLLFLMVFIARQWQGLLLQIQSGLHEIWVQ